MSSTAPISSGTSWQQKLRSLPRDARDTLFLLAVIAWIMLPQAQHMPWWSSAFAAALLLWRARLALTGTALPGRWVLAGALAIAIAATWATHKTIVGRDAGVTLVVMLLALKTLELRARRDAMVVFFLGFFVLLSNFSIPSPAHGCRHGAGIDGTAHGPGQCPYDRWQATSDAGAAHRSQAGTLGAPVMVALFLFFPRMAPLWGVPADDLAGRSGLSENMRVGEVAALAMDDSVALRIRFDTPGEKSHRPPRCTFAALCSASSMAATGKPIRSATPWPCRSCA